MIYPKPLKKGDTVAVIGISGVVKKDKEKVLKNIEEKLRNLGLKGKVHPSVFKEHGYFSGTDEERKNALMEAFLDLEVKGVFCARGGYGVSRLLDKVDYKVIQKNPKVLVGYSDITALHTAIQQKCGVVTYHGPMVTTDKMDLQENYFSLNSLKKTIMAQNPLGEVKNPENIPIYSLVKGKTEGILTGGNLTLISQTLGTPYEIDTKDKILFLEDIGEKTYSIDRMLSHLKLAGKLRDCRGIVLGTFTDCEVEDENHGLTLEDIFKEILVPLQKPILANLQAGHNSPTLTLALGGFYKLDGDKEKFYWVK